MPRRKRKPVARKTLDPSLPVFQLKIALDDVEPEIWRRVQVPDCPLADLHEIIQCSMGWDDEHMHAFEIGDEQYTDLGRGADPYEFHDSRSVRLSNLVDRGWYLFDYEYDFGDSWRHTIEIESTLPPEENARYPRCVDGRRACPPEDSGGPHGYGEVLDALANPDEEEYAERLEWLGDDFDPEAFSVDEVNGELLRLRRWIGQLPQLHGPAARFAVGDRIRAKRGVAHWQYPDIPLGGWIGTVTKIAWLIPIAYQVRWTDETLAAAHPVYAKRCRRDDAEPATHWLDEAEMEPDSAERAMEMEQPTDLVVRPLSADDQDDRIRTAFALTSDDPLPEINDDTQRQYHDYLKTHLAFPFDATYRAELTPYSEAIKHVTVVGLASPSPIDFIRGVICEARCGEETERVALADLELDEDDPNCQYVDDYDHWWEDVQDFAGYDEEDDEGYCDDGEGEEDNWDKDAEDEGDFGPRLAGNRDPESSGPQPIRREQPPVGRNDPCPCGSGEKFKKCCLRKSEGGMLD